ncbi:hypothetical protein ACIGZJ_31095 [Kitasatospora sp. NPDC052868]|uniref:hypothetical protein n=1 Tax=Kitasatospora sp. NPDC052868 TaxID=3364060 RepID=UPI0037CA86EB
MNQTQNNAYQYEWTAANAQEALNILEAAQRLIEARLKVIAPNETLTTAETRRRTPIELTIRLDESAAVLAGQEINDFTRSARLAGDDTR